MKHEKKERLVGASFYREKDLASILTHVPKPIHLKLKRMALKKGLSLDNLIAEYLIDFAKRGR